MPSIWDLLSPPAPDVPQVPFSASKTGQLAGNIGQGLFDMLALPQRSYQASQGLQQTGQISPQGAMDSLGAAGLGMMGSAAFPRAIYPTSAAVNDLMPKFKPFNPKLVLDDTPSGSPVANLNNDMSRWQEAARWNPNGPSGPGNHAYLTDAQGNTIASVSRTGTPQEDSWLARLWSPTGQGESAVTHEATFSSGEMARRYLQNMMKR
jgi:hypothetical protein